MTVPAGWRYVPGRVAVVIVDEITKQNHGSSGGGQLLIQGRRYAVLVSLFHL
jgi:hypothetical protein